MMTTLRDELLDDNLVVRAGAGQFPWCVPEVLLAQGDKPLRRGSSSQAAKLWLVRAFDLARCWTSQDRRDDTAAVVAGVLERCTDGFDTLDVQHDRLLQRAPGGEVF